MKNMRGWHWGIVETGLWVSAVMLMGCLERGILPPAVAGALLVLVVVAAFGVRWYTALRYRDYVHEPIRPEELPRDTYAVFNGYTPEFMQLGCRLVGDFRLAYGPHPVLVRYFLPSDARIRGEVCDHNGTFTPSFGTYFSDGRLIESAVMNEPGRKMSSDSRLWFFKHGRINVAGLYAAHRQAVDAYESSQGVRALAFTPANLADFAQYGHRLVWWERGKLPKHIGEPQLPGAQPAVLEEVVLTP